MDYTQKVIDIIHQEGGIEKEHISPTSNLEDDLRIDSLDLIEIILELEEQLHIQIPDHEYNLFKTVQDIINFVNKELR